MDISEYSYVVVGSGLLGAVIAERIANQLDQPVLVIEKRDHIGGNCYSATDPTTGIEYHKYGTHIFHTSNEKVWNYVRRFITFNTYQHRVLSCYKNRLYPFPINLATINQFYNRNLKPYEVEDFMASLRQSQLGQRADGGRRDAQPAAGPPTAGAPTNFEEQAMSLLGRDLYEAFFKYYTIKQWQVDPRHLPPAIFNRLPFRTNYDDNYFFDRWQGIPEKGYTHLFERLLANRKIKVLLDTDFFEIRHLLKKDACLVYSGAIDRFFDYKHGKLSWRTLRFEQEIIDKADYQGNSVINFPEAEIPYTRIHEPRHLHPEKEYTGNKTIIFREYSLADQGDNPYYPIASEDNQRLLSLYRKEAAQLKNVFISGRLGDYKYYDMHQTIDRALEIFETCILPQTSTIHVV
ncbi:UDP-galactopyranose/dTDP-fucopyranose mutase family protein [Puia dinghuensis]|uniref:UDP-galactopyranose mutase n=1 Tax=Puia dinghuensis TaxID=1792502 RepID=A0A8J2UEI6_9BACT|nr:UDP-galactopyranose mutase [Puia dinghuensis]GGB07020.1 UDP-galactopyranose mutase [Puia dinghuensis]